MALTENHFTCANCSKELVSYTGKAETVACQHCGYALLVSMGQSFVSGKAFTPPNKEVFPLIAVGSEITVHKTVYRVVGVAILREKGKEYTWEEYTLHNDSEGFVTLSTYEHTFNLVRPFFPAEGEFTVNDVTTTAVYKGETYRLYNRYEIQTKYLQGEFSYNPLYLKGTQSREFLNAPDLIILHEKDGNKEFFRAEYVDRKEIQKSLGEYLPARDFVNPTTDLLVGHKPFTVGIAFILSLVLFSVIAAFQNALKPEEIVFKHEAAYTSDTATLNKPIISPSFELTGWGSAISAELNSNVSNDWFAMSFELINETDNSSTYFENGVEYYSGYTDGESWSEGSHDNTVNITGIKPGKYHIVMQPAMNKVKHNTVRADVVIRKNPMFFSNYLIIALLAAAFPVVFIILDRQLDRKRWYFSDYSHYTYNDDDE